MQIAADTVDGKAIEQPLKAEPVSTQSVTANTGSDLLPRPILVRNAAPSVASIATASTRPLLPALASAPSVPSAACAAVSPQPSIHSQRHTEPVSAAAFPSNNIARHREKAVTEAVSTREPSQRQSARLSVLPDVTANITMATKDAFACVNAMFGSSLAHASKPTRNLASMAEPTVTISTKAAFDELNSMFSSDLPHHSKQPKHDNRNIGSRQPGRSIDTCAPKQARQQRRAPSRAGPAPVSVPAVLDVHKDTQSVGMAKNAAAETEGFAIYEDTSFLGSKLNVQHKDDHTTGFAVYEDTGFLDKRLQQIGQQHRLPAEATQGFQVYEDTQCLQAKPPASPANAAPGARIDREVLQRPGTKASVGARNSPGGLAIYEDTACLQNASQKSPVAAQGGSSGLAIYQDTDCLQKPNQKAVTAAQGSPAGLAIYEDTDCLQKPSQEAFTAAKGSPVGLVVHEDTQFVSNAAQMLSKQSLKPTVARQHFQVCPVSSSPARDSPGGFGIYEDTQFVSAAPEHSKRALEPAAQSHKHKPSPVKDEENEAHIEDKENCHGPARYETLKGKHPVQKCHLCIAWPAQTSQQARTALHDVHHVWHPPSKQFWCKHSDLLTCVGCTLIP